MKRLFRGILMLSAVMMFSGLGMIFGQVIPNPGIIEVQGLISFGEDGAAWLKIGPQEILVTPGFLLGRDYRVTAIRHQGVVLYREKTRQYHVAAPPVVDNSRHCQKTVLWCMPMPIWKCVRMIALAYRKDFICQSETVDLADPQRHVPDLNAALRAVVTPHYRFHGRDGIVYVSPVRVFETAWRWFNSRVKAFDSVELTRWFVILGKKGTVVSDGREMADVLKRIERDTGVPIFWPEPIVPLKVYCSFRDRPWGEILQNIIMFNGLNMAVEHDHILIQNQ
jgi:hypothetical protein